MRREFSKETQKQAWKRCKGFCEGCGLPFTPANPPEYDHDIPDGLDSEHLSYPINSLENCKVLGAKCCHVKKTHEVDRPMMAKADRLYKKHVAKTIRPKGTIKSRPFNRSQNSDQ